MEPLPQTLIPDPTKIASITKGQKTPWTRNEDSKLLSPWETIDLDWMSIAEENDEKMQTATTQQYEQKVYSQSITLLITLQTNESNVSASGLSNNPLQVGPWKVPRDSVPVLVGSLAGGCCLLLLGLTLALYACLQKRQSKSYSVKSEASSVLSTRSPKSVLSLSRESLVLVTGSNSGHQARLLSDPSASNNFLFDYSFDFFFDSQNETPRNNGSPKNNGTLPNVSNPSCTEDSISLMHRNTANAKDNNLTQENPSTISASLEKNKRIQLPTINNNEPQDDRLSPGKNGQSPLIGRSFELAELKPEVSREDVDGRCSSRNSCANSTLSTNECFQNSEESLRTRSLPAWVRTKKKPMAYQTDLSSSLYDKGRTDYIPKRQRNRMGSDAAQLIALSKSRIRLLSPGSNCSVSNFLTPVSKETPFEEFINDAVIIYNERTAL